MWRRRRRLIKQQAGKGKEQEREKQARGRRETVRGKEEQGGKLKVTCLNKFVLQLHITNKCNLRCTHCYIEDKSCTSMGLETVKQIITQFKQLVTLENCRGHVNITGGEPFLHRELFSILSLLESENLTFGILTNGILINEEHTKLLSEFNNLQFIQISLDGVPKVHDNIRGKGSYKASTKSINLLKKHNIPVMISCTLHKQNYKQLKQVIRNVEKLGVDRFWCDRLVPIGSNTEQMLTTEQFKESVEVLTTEQHRAQQLNLPTQIHTNRSLQFCSGGNEFYRCSAGDRLLVIDESGNIYPCRRLPILLENIHTMNITLSQFYSTNKTLESIRNEPIPNECRYCLKGTVCNGGAKCIKYAVAGRTDIKDVNCYYKVLTNPV